MHRGGNGPTQVPPTPYSICSSQRPFYVQDNFLVEARWLRSSHMRHLETKHHWVAKRQQASGVCFLRNKDNFPQSPFNIPPLLHVPLASGSQAHSETYHWKEDWTRQTGLWLSSIDLTLGVGIGLHLCVTLEWDSLIVGLWQ